MKLPKEYFELQLEFAHKVSKISNHEMANVLLKYTSFYKTFQISDWDFVPSNPVWQNFIVQFRKAEDKPTAAYEYYLAQKSDPEENRRKFGCFQYEYEEKENQIRIHFKNLGIGLSGPLSKENMPARLKELKDMFMDVKANHPEVPKVAGFSWLYNLESYRRLFPPEYIALGRPDSGWFVSGALWHQFLDSEWNIKTDLVNQFRNCISDKNSIDELETCFPFKVIETEADIKFFYKFYNI